MRKSQVLYTPIGILVSQEREGKPTKPERIKRMANMNKQGYSINWQTNTITMTKKFAEERGLA